MFIKKHIMSHEFVVVPILGAVNISKKEVIISPELYEIKLMEKTRSPKNRFDINPFDTSLLPSLKKYNNDNIYNLPSLKKYNNDTLPLLKNLETS